MADTTKLRAGRSWSVGNSGITELTREYIVIRDDITGANGEIASFSGVPAIGTSHPEIPTLVVSGYDVKEGDGSDKKTLRVTVKYRPSECQTYERETEEGETEDVTYQVDEWGWSDGTEEHELVEDADNNPVVNSVGDPFDRVPTVSSFAPTFTKVMKFKDRQQGAMDFSCCTNDEEITIGDFKCAPGTLLCSVSYKRLIGDNVWKYQYTITLKYRSNLVNAYGESEENIGWDVAIADTGMRAKNSNKEDRLELIRMLDQETGKMCTVSSPALLDGTGHAQTAGGTAVNLKFKAYTRKKIPGWFYSEPD